MPQAAGQLSPCTTTTEPARWSLCSATREASATRGLPTETRESPNAATKAQHSQNKSYRSRGFLKRQPGNLLYILYVYHHPTQSSPAALGEIISLSPSYKQGRWGSGWWGNLPRRPQISQKAESELTSVIQGCLLNLYLKWSEVAESCPTLCDPTDCSPPGSSVHGILQARILECVAISFSRGIFPTQGSNPGLLHCRQML